MLRLPGELLEQLDGWVDRLNEKTTGPQWSRTDLIRAVLTKAADKGAAKGEAP